MVIETIREYLGNGMDVPDKVMNGLKDDDSLFEKGILNSLTTIKLLIFIEKTYDISINMNDIHKENISSLLNIEKFILSSKK